MLVLFTLPSWNIFLLFVVATCSCTPLNAYIFFLTGTAFLTIRLSLFYCNCFLFDGLYSKLNSINLIFAIIIPWGVFTFNFNKKKLPHIFLSNRSYSFYLKSTCTISYFSFNLDLWIANYNRNSWIYLSFVKHFYIVNFERQ